MLKNWENIKNRKYNLRLEKITGAILNIYYGELISIRIDRTINNFIEGEEVIAKAKILKLGYFDIKVFRFWKKFKVW